MKVRRAAPEDARAIAVVHVETWRGAYGHVFPAEVLASLDVEAREQSWRQVLEQGDDAVVAEDEDGAVVGFASIGPAREPDKGGELYAIYVRPACWGTGAGRELMRAAVERLKARGYDDAILWVLEDNPRARRFYEAAGWHADGKKTANIAGVEVAEARYRLALRTDG